MRCLHTSGCVRATRRNWGARVPELEDVELESRTAERECFWVAPFYSAACQFGSVDPHEEARSAGGWVAMLEPSSGRVRRGATTARVLELVRAPALPFRPRTRGRAASRSAASSTIREGLSYGQTHTPRPASARSRTRAAGPPPGPARGGAPGQLPGAERARQALGAVRLEQAFERVRKRAGLEGWSVYCLRLYAFTLWRRRCIPVHRCRWSSAWWATSTCPPRSATCTS